VGARRRGQAAPMIRALARAISRTIVLFLLAMLRAYQLALSPALGPACRFEPSCSEYTRQAIERHGAVIGLWRGAGRLLRCHPFHPGGWDPVR
jgi:uncharacterized protein